MVFCGQCGYQLSPGDKICPRCGAETDVDLIDQDPGTYNPTEISHAVLDPGQGPSPQSRGSLPNRPAQPEQAGPLILGSASGSYPNDQLANESTVMMGSQMYQPQQAYPGYQQQAGMGGYDYTAGGYQQYQAGQSAAAAQLLEASRKGKTNSLLLILFGLLLLIAAIIVFLLNQQGIIFHT